MLLQCVHCIASLYPILWVVPDNKLNWVILIFFILLLLPKEIIWKTINVIFLCFCFV